MNLSPFTFMVAATLAAAPAWADQAVPISGPGTSQASPAQELVSRAREHCRAERGVDCGSASGLKEWVLLERSRAEAVQEGSRRRIVVPRRF